MWPFSTYRYPELEPHEVGVRLSPRSKLPYDGDKDSSSFSSFDYIIVGGMNYKLSPTPADLSITQLQVVLQAAYLPLV